MIATCKNRQCNRPYWSYKTAVPTPAGYCCWNCYANRRRKKPAPPSVPAPLKPEDVRAKLHQHLSSAHADQAGGLATTWHACIKCQDIETELAESIAWYLT